jgi:hypothetical protein
MYSRSGGGDVVTVVGRVRCKFVRNTLQVVRHTLQEATYAGGWMLISVLILWMHIKASKSPAVRDAQRLLHLPDLHSPQLGQSLRDRDECNRDFATANATVAS